PSWQSDDPTWSGPDLADVFAGSGDTDIAGDAGSSPSPTGVAPSVPGPSPTATPVPGPPRRSELDDWGPDGRPSPPRVDTSEGRPIPGTEPVIEPAAGLDHTEIANHRDLDIRPAPIDDQRPADDLMLSSGGVVASDTDAAIRTQPRRRVVSSPPSVEARPRSAADSRVGVTEHGPVAGDPTIARSDDLRIERQPMPSDDEPTAPGLFTGSETEDRYFEGEAYDGYRDLENLDEPGGRSLPQAIGAAAVMAGVVLAALWIGPQAMMVVVCAAALLAVIELFNAMRLAGLRPATLLGLLATVGFPVAAYFRGDVAFTVVMALSVVFGMLWYLAGADHERPVLNLSLTILGVLWIGGCGAFAAMILRQDEFGVQLLLSTIVIAVVSDTMAYFGGRAFGRRPFHSASPNKTWEGTMTGFVFAVFCAFAMAVMPFSTMWDGRFLGALALGAVVGVMTPMGDLAESLVKRDLGVKDMGTIVPGHGGLLDRIDGLLFALPGAYFLAVLLGIF
ncbi:MAG: phosphatidate cytidylyltransferase, partial [Acidimicrobiia bacterium]|nr:phosphatidate cytidylyltransferase [Acidimicrobiia bacterium]